MPKITVRCSQKDFHVFSGAETRFFLRDNICEVVSFENQTRRILGAFVDYIWVKEDKDKNDEQSRASDPFKPVTRAEENYDPFTAAAVADRDPNEKPDFDTLKAGAPIEMPEEPEVLPLLPDAKPVKGKALKNVAAQKKGRRMTDK